MIPAKKDGSAKKLNDEDPAKEVEVCLLRHAKEDGGGKVNSFKTNSSWKGRSTIPQHHAVIPCESDEVDDVFEDCYQTAPLLQKDVLGASRKVLMSGSLVGAPTLNDVVGELKVFKEKSTEEVDSLNTKVKEHGEEIKKLQDSEGEPLLPEDSYSFLAITRRDTRNSCRHIGSTFYMGVGVLVFQALTLSLLAVDTIDIKNDGNWLDIPAGVTVPVRISQIIAIIITVVSQDEVRLSLNIWYYGYDEGAVWNAFCCEAIDASDDSNESTEADTTQEAANAKANIIDPDFARMMRARWYLSAFLRFVIGLLCLAVTFMLLITVDSVRELLLNFTAVEFISNVDDAVFLLSSWGYFGEPPKTDAGSIVDAKWPLDKKDGRFFLCNWKLFYKSVKMEGRKIIHTKWIEPMIGYDNDEFIPHADGCEEQAKAGVDEENSYKDGKDKENRDEKATSTMKIPINAVWMVLIFIVMFAAWLPLVIQQQVNGQYRTNTVYVQFGDEFSAALGTFSGLYKAGNYNGIGRRVDYVSEDKAAIFRYCTDDRVWAFLYGDTRIVDVSKFGRECEKRQWIRAVSSETFTFDLFDTAEDQWFFREPDTEKDLPMQHFSLRESGKTVVQSCTKGNEGDENVESCRKPCDVLVIDEQYHQFADARSWSLNYTTLKDDGGLIVQAYDRPVYIGNKTHHENVRDLMFFTGRRWVITRTDEVDSLGKASGVDDIISFFSNNFHAHWSTFSVIFISAAVDVDSPDDKPTPIGLRWFNTKRKVSDPNPIQAPNLMRAQQTVFLCAICGHDYDCEFGRCVMEKQGEGRCQCEHGAEGTLCQLLPTGNGICNSYFNTEGYGWDAGDCCPGTCESTKYSCGTNHTVVFGLQVQEYIGYPYCSDPSQARCEDGQTCWKVLVDLQGTEKDSQAGTFVAVSGNGAVVALLEQGISEQVRVFENNGKDWIQRGDLLTNTDKATTNDTGSFKSAIGLSKDGSIISTATNGVLRTYYWSLEDNEWNRLGMNHLNITSAELSSDGFTLATNSNDGKKVSVYRYELGREWLQLGQNISFEEESKYRTMSLSGDGTTLAVSFGLENWTLAVYKYKESEKLWKPFGPAVDSGGLDIHTVSLSENGQVLALGTDRNVRVFSYQHNSTNATWTPRGSNITNVYARSLSLSEDGSFLALGATKRQVDVTDGVEIYEFDQSHNRWNRLMAGLRVAINDESGASVSLSHDGSVIVFGAPKYGGEQYGTVQVRWRSPELPSSSVVEPSRSSKSPNSTAASRSSTMSKLVNITVEIQLDDAPWETSMDLVCEGVSYGSVSRGALRTQRFRGHGVILVPRGASCTFTIADFRGDGICCSKGSGFYNIYYGDMVNKTSLIATGGRMFGTLESVTFTVNDRPQQNTGSNDDEKRATSLTPISIQLFLNTIVPSNTSLNTFFLNCKGILDLMAPPGTFQNSAEYRTAQFLLPVGTHCIVTMGFEGETSSQWNGNYIVKERGVELFKGYLNDPNSFHVRKSEGCSWETVPTPSPPLECIEGENLLRLELNTSEYGAEALWSVNGTSKSFNLPCSRNVSQVCVPDDSCTNYTLSNIQALPGPSKEVSYKLLLGNETIISSDETFRGQRTCSVGSCGETKWLRVELRTDKFAEDTSFAISDGIDGHEYYRQGPFKEATDDQREFYFEYCVPADACLLFSIEDFGGDGICCEFGNGYYKVLLDSELVLEGGDFTGSVRSHDPFGNCPVVIPPTESPPPSPLAANSTAAPISNLPTLEPPLDECSAGFSLLRLELLLDQYPSDTSFAVINDSNGTVYLKGGPYSDETDIEQLIQVETCVPDICLLFIISDTNADGICCENGDGYYKVFLDGELELEGGKFDESTEERPFGSCTETETP